MRDSSQGGDVSGISEILMSNDGFTDCFRLCYFRFKRFQEVKGDVAALELEREASTALVLGSRSYVVEQASQQVCLWAELPLGEVLFDYRLS